MSDHIKWMQMAVREAEKAAQAGEVPVGAVVVENDELVALAHNLRETTNDPTAHAEMLCLREAGIKLRNRRLSNCTLYVTLQPCPMCAGAMVMAGLQKCYFGARDQRQGCVESIYAIPQDPAFYHHVSCCGGLMETECESIMNEFFQSKRKGALT